MRVAFAARKVASLRYDHHLLLDTTLTPDAYAAMDSWTLKQLDLDPGDIGDSTDQSLWLDQFQHTGEHGTAVSWPR
ncbi:hypothetical protein ACIP98_39755 [Streptomyces sp. NPDC088354]|uniref:hypothetical protein n=1 Tax=Streptomyces sp. NPDC088354 TaxID=3365856 RepID=UPI0038176407